MQKGGFCILKHHSRFQDHQILYVLETFISTNAFQIGNKCSLWHHWL